MNNVIIQCNSKLNPPASVSSFVAAISDEVNAAVERQQ
jgi:hypothetical protein